MMNLQENGNIRAALSTTDVLEVTFLTCLLLLVIIIMFFEVSHRILNLSALEMYIVGFEIYIFDACRLIIVYIIKCILST